MDLFRQSHCDPEWPLTNAVQFANWFAGKLGEVPEQYRASAKIEIDAYDYCGALYAQITIYYIRPESDDEMAAREAREQRLKSETEAAELRTLERLKAKYPGQARADER